MKKKTRLELRIEKDVLLVESAQARERVEKRKLEEERDKF